MDFFERDAVYPRFGFPDDGEDLLGDAFRVGRNVGGFDQSNDVAEMTVLAMSMLVVMMSMSVLMRASLDGAGIDNIDMLADDSVLVELLNFDFPVREMETIGELLDFRIGVG